MIDLVPSNVCPVCDTPDGDHLDWCTPQAREQRPSKEQVDFAIRLAQLWRAGKMIGGDEDEVRDILLGEIERLRTALHGIQSCSTCEACRGAATLALGGATPEPPAEPQWISTKDRMPEEGQRILGHAAPNSDPTMEAADGDPDVYVRVGSKWLNRNSFNYLGSHATVIYWMPCPENPRDPETPRAAQPPGDGR